MPLTRKKFLRRLATLATGIPILGSAACRFEKSKPLIDIQATESAQQSTQTYHWNMVTTWPPNFPVLGESCSKFANWVKEMSNGRLNITVYGAGELVPALEVFDTVRAGVNAQIGNSAAYYWAGKAPATQFFASVPFGMNAQQMNAWILKGGGLELWRELYADFGLIPFLAGNTGVQMGGWFNKEINSIDDFKGLKMRIPGFGGKVIERAGGTARLSAGGEIFTDLERGVIDATEWIGPYHDYKMGFYEVAKYYYSPGWHEPGTAMEMIVNKAAYELLPKDLQVIIDVACAKSNAYVLAEFESKNNEYLTKIRENTNVSIRTFPPEVLAQLKTYTLEIMEEITASDEFSARVYDSFITFKKAAVAWSEVTEKPFYNYIQ